MVRLLSPMSMSSWLQFFYYQINYFSRRKDVKDISHVIYFMALLGSWMELLTELFVEEKVKSISKVSVYTSKNKPTTSFTIQGVWCNKLPLSVWLFPIETGDTLGTQGSFLQLVGWTLISGKKQISLKERKPMLLSSSVIYSFSLPWRLCRWAHWARTQVSKKTKWNKQCILSYSLHFEILLSKECHLEMGHMGQR